MALAISFFGSKGCLPMVIQVLKFSLLGLKKVLNLECGMCLVFCLLVHGVAGLWNVPGFWSACQWEGRQICGTCLVSMGGMSLSMRCGKVYGMCLVFGFFDSGCNPSVSCSPRMVVESALSCSDC
jgi:hypothetical protein